MASLYKRQPGEPHTDNIYRLTFQEIPNKVFEEEDHSRFSIFPNPANDLLTLETGSFNQYSIEIATLSGQLIYRTIMEGTTHQLDLSSFQMGIYIMTIRSEDFVRAEKIVKL
jgi:hypothetical protein